MMPEGTGSRRNGVRFTFPHGNVRATTLLASYIDTGVFTDARAPLPTRLLLSEYVVVCAWTGDEAWYAAGAAAMEGHARPCAARTAAAAAVGRAGRSRLQGAPRYRPAVRGTTSGRVW